MIESNEMMNALFTNSCFAPFSASVYLPTDALNETIAVDLKTGNEQQQNGPSVIILPGGIPDDLPAGELHFLHYISYRLMSQRSLYLNEYTSFMAMQFRISIYNASKRGVRGVTFGTPCTLIDRQ